MTPVMSLLTATLSVVAASLFFMSAVITREVASFLDDDRRDHA